MDLVSRRKKEPPDLDKPTIDQGNLERSFADGNNYGLQLLYDGADADHPDFDFVAVHGIGGHPLKSFTHAETGCCWLRDLLPRNSPHCRVFSYGYPTDVPERNPSSHELTPTSLQWTPTSLELTPTSLKRTPTSLKRTPTSLEDQASALCLALAARAQAITRRCIFICHSTGGLLVKRVLIKAHLDSQLVDVYKYTSGIIFLGTPHRGSSSADLAHTLGKILRVIPGAPLILLHDVLPSSSQVEEINESFAHLANQSLLIGSFYETLNTWPFDVITGRSSAILNFRNEICISLEANHAQLCKFKGPDDRNYKKVLNVIDQFRRNTPLPDDPVNKSPDSLSASPSQESLSKWIPRVASKKGTTSMGLLEMAGSMEHPKDYVDAEMDIIAVHGLGGSPVRSWTSSYPQTMWLRDMLQVDVSTARVMSYGYRTEDILRRNKFDLDRLAKDLVDSIIDARADIQNNAVRIAES